MYFKRLLINTRINDIIMITYAANRKQVDGIVIGDPFCLKRAGISIFDIPGLCRNAKKQGLYVSYQSPVYLTPRNMDTTYSLIETLVKESLVNEIRIQDLGLLHRLEKITSSGINITWSIYGYQREFPGMDIPINQSQVDFLRSKGIDSFEVTSAVAFSIFEDRLPLNFSGNKPGKRLPDTTKMQIQHYKFDPVTFSRKCYTEAYTGKCCVYKDEGSEFLACDELFYLEEDAEGGSHLPPMKYIVEGHRVLEFPDPAEFKALVDSKINVENLILSGNDIEEIEELIRKTEPDVV